MEQRIFGVRWVVRCLRSIRYDGVSLPSLWRALRKQWRTAQDARR